MRSIKSLVKYLCSKRHLVGLSDYEMFINAEFKDMSGSLALVNCDVLEKELRLVLSNDFKKLSKDRQNNVLMHELVHARINIFNIKKETIVNELEEDLANDLTRGFERGGVL